MVQVRPDGAFPAAGGASTACPSVGTAPPSLPAVDGPPLDLHEGISDPATGCVRWPRGLRLRNEVTGELVLGRCKATNLCRYCQQLYVIETLTMLRLDAAEWAPEIWIVLTARQHLARRDTYRHLEQLRLAARRRWPSIEWFVQVEFQRRGALHLNLLVKGVGGGDREALHELIVSRWCDRLTRRPGRGCEGPVYVGAEPVGQWSGLVRDAGGVTRYLQKTLAHGLKSEQAPPLGWKGHRTSQTRGYLVASASVMRRRAREAMALERELWRLDQGESLGAYDRELLARRALEERARSVWVLATDRGAAVAGAVYDPPASALHPRTWREPDLLDSARYLLGQLPDGLKRVGHARPREDGQPSSRVLRRQLVFG